MPRVKGAVNALKNRRKTLKRAKGYRHGASTKERLANQHLFHAGVNAFNDRKSRKNDYRRLWQTRIAAAVRPLGTSYSAFMGALKAANIDLNRKMLAEMATNEPDTFKTLVQSVSAK